MLQEAPRGGFKRQLLLEQPLGAASWRLELLTLTFFSQKTNINFIQILTNVLTNLTVDPKFLKIQQSD